MKRSLVPFLIALTPAVVGVLLAFIFARGWLNNPVFVGSFEVDLAAIVSRFGLLLSILGIMVAFVNLRSERLASREREKARAQQEAANRRFMRRLDHELKNPLTILRLGVVNLQQGANLTREQQSSLERLSHQVHRLQKLIEDLRRLSELEARELERMTVSMVEVLEEAASLARNLPNQSERVIDLNLQQAPWPLGNVLGDRDLLIIAFRNLLDNALKFTSAEDQVEVRATDNGHSATIEVADTGLGIPDEELPHIFEELYRGRAAKRVEGSGLGLAMARRIIHIHGGEISVRSRDQQGTVLTVHLPLKRSEG
jgi:two-component system OmpR family sensor kinase